MTTAETTRIGRGPNPAEIGFQRTVKVFSSDLSSTGAFRAMIRRQLGGRTGQKVENAVSIGSEIAANAAGHGTPEGPPETQIFLAGIDLSPGGKTYLYAADNSEETPVISIGGADWNTRVRGRGLAMVADLSIEWGYREVPPWMLELNPYAKKVVFAVAQI